MLSARIHAAMSIRPLRWSFAVCVALAGWVVSERSAVASCGDYVHIGNPRFAMDMGHEQSMPVRPGDLADPSSGSERPCQGPHCRQAPNDSQIPPTRMMPPQRLQECLLTSAGLSAGEPGTFLSAGSLVLVPQPVSSGLFRPPRDC